MDYEERLGVLLAAAEEQEKAAKKAVESLTTMAQQLKTAPEGLKKAVEASMSENLWRVSGSIEKTVLEATKGANGRINEAAAAMERARQWMSWQWVALAGLLAVALVAVVFIASWAITDSYRTEIAEARAVVAQLENRGGKAKLSTCEGRLCVAVVKGAAYGDKKDTFMVIKTD